MKDRDGRHTTFNENASMLEIRWTQLTHKSRCSDRFPKRNVCRRRQFSLLALAVQSVVLRLWKVHGTQTFPWRN